MVNRPLTTSGGENTSAPYGIARFLFRLIEDYEPEYLGVKLGRPVEIPDDNPEVDDAIGIEFLTFFLSKGSVEQNQESGKGE